jgi:two-component system sensor histidine kinase MtrB
VPAQQSAGSGHARPARDPIPPRPAAASPAADPTALPGNGARVVPRPVSPARRQDGPSAVEPSAAHGGEHPAGRPEEDPNSQGEACRGR